jgi:hypothetical protein
MLFAMAGTKGFGAHVSPPVGVRAATLGSRLSLSFFSTRLDQDKLLCFKYLDWFYTYPQAL